MMVAPGFTATPVKKHYDVVIIGGAMIGSSVAWFLSSISGFDGSVLVIEKDPGYTACSTAHTNSCIRQQFSNEINIRISQFGVETVRNFRAMLGGDPDIPEITLHDYGYMYLADNEDFASILRDNQATQAALGAGTRLLNAEQIGSEYPFYNLDGIILGSHNPLDEGYFDGHTMFDWWKRMARRNGVEYCAGEVVAMTRQHDRITEVSLADGSRVECGTVVNASGPRAARTAAMAGLEIPVEPRRRYTFIFDAETPLEKPLPLTIDPSGVHMRSDGKYYLCGCPPDQDPAVDFDDFDLDYSIWEDKIWPAIANRVPAFEAVKVINAWVGHYAYNTLDHNAVIGPHPECSNFIFVNGFSGHGFQQSPAMGRGVAELICHGGYRSLDLSPLGYERIIRNEPFLERAVI